MLDHDRDAQDRIVKPARLLCLQVDLADDAVHACALVRDDLEVGAQVVEIEHVELALKVGRIVPLDHRVFNHADAAQVTVNLHYSVRVLVVSVLVVVQDCFSCRLADLRDEPLDAVDV